jgi:hypothetical protein
MSEEWCECRSEVGWNGVKGMFMSACIPRGPAIAGSAIEACVPWFHRS